MGRYTVRQADRVTERQNDSMTIWQNSRAAKEAALVKEPEIMSVYNFALHDLSEHLQVLDFLDSSLKQYLNWLLSTTTSQTQTQSK